MINKENIEAFYDYFDGVANVLYENYKKPYIEGMNEAFNFLLDNVFEGEYQLEDIEKVTKMKEKVTNVEFEREEIRKSVQLGMLKGYKHTFSSNALITPDTIGIFMGYLVRKLMDVDSIKSVLDPVVGSGNLIYTVLNQLEISPKVFGVDSDLAKCNLARNLGDLLDYDNEMFFQDTLSYFDHGFDLILADMPIVEDVPYLPYQIINHHFDALNDGGFFISLIENDFFEQKGSEIFREEIQKKGYIFGLIKLSETLFKNHPKSILILRKKGDNVQSFKDFLLVDLPSFNDAEAFNNTINQIDSWISSREDEVR
jgi:site-specific DNA-methyltransferase (adenine-specific)